MTRPRESGDAGQAFPIYITVVAGLLFLAFAYLAVGQTAVNRNGAETAADAAALAAAQDTRDKLAGEWVRDVLDPTKWQDVFSGKGAVLDGCWRAYQLAAQNDAHMAGSACGPQSWPLGYRVEVETNRPVGDSVVPATSHTRSRAEAVAVIEPRCMFDLPVGQGGKGTLPQLNCKGRTWHLNPDDLTDLPGPEDLFDVHLAAD
ncbi:pilus assembly protein TadG-related protein [Streptomyces tropicalis]|uniref:Pilus assembly protein TadG-related protein n=1 Tax=Streptomyces tropicalis TaxID=3034234 RepID=A0ABT6A0G3_9ACTN|nr:pilus assembly protein TadG-related protein [Streptomyces tropicalis]MDF3298137.1 pilus assembly protein TadG-related protein [Streptomyces tropicalis]